MKYLKLLYFLLYFFLSTFGYSENHLPKNETKCSDSCESKEKLSQISNNQVVYICTGSYAYAYHSRSDCPGLSNCKGEIKYTDENTAANSLGRVPCCRCWANVSGRCKDDNPYYSSYKSGGGYNSGTSDNSEAYAYLALAIISTSAIILSNDIYIYPTISFFKHEKNNNYYGQISNNGIGTGWIFGFRKTFSHSALEYGASYLKSKIEYKNLYGSQIYEKDRWGWHLNYVHQFFYNKTPHWLKIYFGPSLNYVYEYGYGGIIGAEIKLFDRLKFDVRYEYTNQTNQIQTGLIFTYQKKYFWQRR